jgi:hypothetical protein
MPKVWLVLAACVLVYAAMMIDARVPLGGGLEVVHATIEKPTDGAVMRMTNATDQAVDIYVNHAESPTMTDVKALSIGPEFQVKGQGDTPYGTYTFTARPKAQPGAPVIAAASVRFTEGASVSAVLHGTPAGGHQIAIYADDFSPTGAALLTVRNNSRAQQISWRIAPKDVNPSIPYDERQGTLGNGQSQVAIDVTQNDYVLEFLIDGQVVGRHPDVELEHEKNRVLTLVGDPQPSADPSVLRRHVLEQEFQVPLGPAQPDEVTPPADPLSTTDENAPLELDCAPVSVWQTNPAGVQISAIDPDGVVTNLAVDRIDPPVGGIGVSLVTASPAIGEAALATLVVGGDVPAGSFAVRIVVNRGSLGHQATCTLAVTVNAITIPRLRDLIGAFRASGDIRDDIADQLLVLLDQAEQQLAQGATAQACQTLKDVAAGVASEKGKAIAQPAGERLERETKALRSNAGCG